MENSREFCRFLLPCGYCELKKVDCNKYRMPNIVTYPITTEKYFPDNIKVGDWPPGPQPTCKDLASDSDTFRVHFEDQPRYSSMCTDTGKPDPSITTYGNNFDINTVKQKLTNEK